METTLQDIVHRLETASRKPDLLEAMQMAAGAFRFQAFSVTTRLVHVDEGACRVVLSSLPREFLAWYDHERVVEKDVYLHRSMTAPRPFHTDELPDEGPGAGSPSPITDRLAGHGLLPGMYCSQHAANGGVTTAAFFGGCGHEDRDDVRERAAWVTAHLHEALDRVVIHPLVAKRGIGALTRVERSILELLARGYGAKEISRLLSVSPRSVRYYADRIRDKLAARSLNHAMSRAIEGRQVTLSGSALPSHWGGLPKLVQVDNKSPAWSVQDPSLDMAIREVRSSGNLELLAQATQRGVSAMGFGEFAFSIHSPGSRDGQRVVLTNDARAHEGWERAGSLVAACLRPRPRDTRCVPVLRDDVLARAPAHARPPGVPVPDVRATTFLADGTVGALVLSRSAVLDADAFATRRDCFRLAREVHATAAGLLRRHAPVLSEPEKLALLQMSAGATIRKVARIQGQKERTVRYRVSRVAEKLGARNARHALAIATEAGLLPRNMGPLLSRDLVSPRSLYTAPERHRTR